MVTQENIENSKQKATKTSTTDQNHNNVYNNHVCKLLINNWVAMLNFQDFTYERFLRKKMRRKKSY